MKFLTSLIISVLLGCVFLFSGYSKLFPVDFFESDLYTSGFIPWIITPFLARIIIGAEFLIGLLLLFNLHFKKRVYIFSGVLLLIFTTQLFIQIILNGNQGDCGCFGNAIHMTPLQAIAKNIVMLAMLVVLYRSNTNSLNLKRPLLIFILIASVAVAIPFIVSPILISRHSFEAAGSPLPLDLLYSDSNNTPPKPDLRKGKWIIAYFSLSCPHCKIAANKLQAIIKSDPEIPAYMVLNGDKEYLEKFLKETKSENIPHTMFLGENFVKMSTTSLPAIFLVNNSIIENRLDYVQFSPDVVREWFQDKNNTMNDQSLQDWSIKKK